MTTEAWAGIVGLFMPLVVEVVKTKLPDNRIVGYSIALVISLLVGGGSAFFAGQFDPSNILSSTGAAFIAAQTVYAYWFKPQNIDRIVQKAMA